MKRIVTALVFFISVCSLHAQVPSDSLIQLIRTTKNDSLLARLHRQAGLALKKEGKLDEAIKHYLISQELYQQQGDFQNVAKTFNNLGSVYTSKGEFELALESYLNSLRIYEQQSDSLGQVKSHINIGNFHARQQQFQKAEEHYKQALTMLAPQDLKNKALLNLNLGGINTDLHNKQADLVAALRYYEDAKKAFTQIGDSVSLAGIFNNIGVLKEQQKELQEAYDHYHQALVIRKRIGDALGIAQSYDNLGNVQRLRGAHAKALEYYQLSLEKTKEMNALQQMQYALHNLSGTYLEMGEHQKAFEFRLKYDSLKDILFNEEKSRQLAELETKYETEKKDQELLVKEATIKQKTAERNTSMITLLVTIVLSTIVIVVYHQRQRAMKELALKNEELHNRQISEMLKEQEIKSINAMLEGQDRERKRIAEDLHDRLGSTLSAVKLHLNALNGAVNTNMPAPLYLNVNGLLDQAVGEVRDIAHNMVSGVLTKFGLSAALHDLKETIEASRQVKVELIVQNLDERLEGQVEINLYRIIQELMSNILKHAKATEITIQLNKVNQELLLMVEDNGIGFDPVKASRDKGMGLRNIESRVAALGGRLNIDSGKGRGTTTTIEIPLA